MTDRDRRSVRVDVASRDLAAVPGQPATIVVTIYNNSDIIEGYRVSLAGLSEAGVASSPEVLSLFPEAEGTLVLTVTPPRDHPAGAHQAVLRVEPTVGTGPAHETSLTVTVAPLPATTVSLEPQTVTGGSRARFAVVAENRGNVPVTLHVTGTDPERRLAFQFAQPQLLLDPAQRVIAPFVVRARRPFIGAPVPRMVSVRAVTTADPVPAQPLPVLDAFGTFVQRPLVPRAVLTLGAVLLALAMWGAVLYQGVDRAATQVASEVAGQGTSMIVGKVSDGQGGLGGVQVQAAGGSGSASTTTLTAGDVGSFTVKGLKGGESYVLTLSKDGFSSLSYEVAMPAGEGAVVSTGTIVLGRGAATISGTVKDAAGTPVGDVTVTVSAAERVVARALTASSGPVGFFSVSGLGAGTYTVTFERFGFTSTSLEVKVDSGRVVAADGVLTPLATGSITGRVGALSARGQPCDAAVCALGGVQVEAAQGEAKVTTVTLSTPRERAGRYAITNLPPGRYTVTFTKEGFQSQVLEVDIGVGQEVAVDVRLRGVPATITGTAADCRSVEVRHRDLKPLDPPAAATPGDDGSFVISEVPAPGEYRLVFDGPALRTLDVSLAAGEERAVTVSCARTTTTTAAPTTTTSTTTLAGSAASL
jgi:hypothetical protein